MLGILGVERVGRWESGRHISPWNSISLRQLSNSLLFIPQIPALLISPLCQFNSQITLISQLWMAWHDTKIEQLYSQEVKVKGVKISNGSLEMCQKQGKSSSLSHSPLLSSLSLSPFTQFVSKVKLWRVEILCSSFQETSLLAFAQLMINVTLDCCPFKRRSWNCMNDPDWKLNRTELGDKWEL